MEGKAYDRLRMLLMRMALIISFSLAGLELLIFFLLQHAMLLEVNFSQYSKSYLAYPFLVNVTLCYVGNGMLKYKRFSARFKNMIPILCLSCICFWISCVHNYFIVTICFYSIVILTSGLFSDSVISKFTTLLSIALVLVSAKLTLYDADSRNDKFVFEVLLTIIFFVIAYLFTRVIIQYNKEQEHNLKKIRNRLNDLEQVLLTDALTGVCNRRGFDYWFDAKYEECLSEKKPLTLVVIDIDNFKKVNDTYGHENGNLVLIKLAEVLRKNCKDGVVCRYGGEEFAIVFAYLKDAQTKKIMECARKEFQASAYPFLETGGITFSCGIQQHDKRFKSQNEFFEKADQVMYFAKKNGKNRCCIGYRSSEYASMGNEIWQLDQNLVKQIDKIAGKYGSDREVEE